MAGQTLRCLTKSPKVAEQDGRGTQFGPRKRIAWPESFSGKSTVPDGSISGAGSECRTPVILNTRRRAVCGGIGLVTTTNIPERRYRYHRPDNGDDDPLPACGHLGSGESEVKPTFRGRSFYVREKLTDADCDLNKDCGRCSIVSGVDTDRLLMAASRAKSTWTRPQRKQRSGQRCS